MTQTPPAEDIHIRVTRLYFRLLLPLSGLALALASVNAAPVGRRVLLPLALLSLGSGLLYRLASERFETALRVGFAVALVAFVSVVAFLGMFMTLPGDGTQMVVLFLFAPVTVFAWGLLFFDRPRLGLGLSMTLSVAATLLLWRWDVQGVQPSGTTPPLLLLVNLIVMYYNSLVLDLNRQFILGREERHQDPLTGLLNRRAFEERAPQLTRPLHVAVLDLDHFKSVNDTYGHPAGDRVLRAVGDVLLDKLGQRGEAYRWGGEEFVVLAPQTRALGVSGFLDLLESVRAEVAGRSFVDDQHVTLSAGVSLAEPGQPLAAAFAQADQALLLAKRLGRNRTEVASAVPEPAAQS